MMAPIPVNLAVEDVLSEAVLRQMLAQAVKPYAIGRCFSRGGYGYLRRTISGFNNAARGCPFAVLSDLDTAPCASALITSWLTVPQHPNLIFRIAIREVEAWVLADRAACATFLGFARAQIPTNVDEIADPKAFLLDLVRSHSSRSLRDDLLPPDPALRKVGPLYNTRLTQFVSSRWRAGQAKVTSPSLGRAIARLDAFVPLWSPGVQ